MNIMEMMKKAQTLQQDIERIKQEIERETFQGDAGAGAVTVTMNGDGSLKKVTIAPALLQAEQAEIVQDLLVASVNQAMAERREYRREKMQSITAGLPIPAGLMG